MWALVLDSTQQCLGSNWWLLWPQVVFRLIQICGRLKHDQVDFWCTKISRPYARRNTRSDVFSGSFSSGSIAAHSDAVVWIWTGNTVPFLAECSIQQSPLSPVPAAGSLRWAGGCCMVLQSLLGDINTALPCCELGSCFPLWGLAWLGLLHCAQWHCCQSEWGALSRA